MRKRLALLLMIPLLLLPGCGEREETMQERFGDFRQAVTLAQHISVQAALTADYGDTVQSYTLAVDYDGQETVMQVIEPDLLAGVTARVQWGETSLEYDNVLLAAGTLDDQGLTPVSAVPAMLQAMASGYVELVWGEDGYMAARLYVSDSSVCTLWLEPDTLTPVYGELASDGKRVLSCEFTDWEIS
jgi:hypothetical protein